MTEKVARASLRTPDLRSLASRTAGKKRASSTRAEARICSRGLAELAEGGADDELEVLACRAGGWLTGLEAADEGLVEHPLDAGVEQGGVLEVGDGAIEPEMDGGDGGVGEVGERGLDALARRGVFGERGEEACGLLEGEGEEQAGRVVAVAVGGGGLPEAIGEVLDASMESMLVRGWRVVPCCSASCGDGGVEVGERLRGDAEAAAGGGLEEGLVEDLAGVAGGAAVEGVVERADDDGLPEVADGAFGLARALEPGGEGFVVGGGVGAEEVEEAEGDAGFVGEGEHGRAEEAERGVAGRWERGGGDVAAAGGGGAGRRFEEGDGVVPADVLAGAGEVAEVDEVGAAAEEDVLGVDDFVEGGVGVGVGAAADEGLALEERDAGSGAGEGDGGGEAGGACAEDEDVGGGLVAHPKSLALKDWRMPRERMASFCEVGTETRSREDGGGVLGDAVEQAVVDADEDAHGGAGVGVEQWDELVGAAVEGLGVELEAAEESEFVGLAARRRRRARGCARG